MNTWRGTYYGTEIGGKWWKRYAKDGWLSSFKADIWVDARGLNFRKRGAKTVLTIPRHSITGLTAGRWHVGRWSWKPILKVQWTKNGVSMLCGFVMSGGEKNTLQMASQIGALITSNDDGAQ